MTVEQGRWSTLLRGLLATIKRTGSRRYINELGGREESTLAAFGGKVPGNLAGLVNEAVARALEIDEVNDVLSRDRISKW